MNIPNEGVERRDQTMHVYFIGYLIQVEKSSLMIASDKIGQRHRKQGTIMFTLAIVVIILLGNLF